MSWGKGNPFSGHEQAGLQGTEHLLFMRWLHQESFSFNWGIVALQYFASFCCKELHQLYGIYLPSLLDSPPMPPSHHSLSPQSTDLSCLCYTTGSHQLYISHMVARTWRPTNCPSTGGWIKKMWYIYIMEYYLAIKGMILGHF